MRVSTSSSFLLASLAATSLAAPVSNPSEKTISAHLHEMSTSPSNREVNRSDVDNLARQEDTGSMTPSASMSSLTASSSITLSTSASGVFPLAPTPSPAILEGLGARSFDPLADLMSMLESSDAAGASENAPDSSTPASSGTSSSPTVPSGASSPVAASNANASLNARRTDPLDGILGSLDTSTDPLSAQLDANVADPAGLAAVSLGVNVFSSRNLDPLSDIMGMLDAPPAGSGTVSEASATSTSPCSSSHALPAWPSDAPLAVRGLTDELLKAIPLKDLMNALDAAPSDAPTTAPSSASATPSGAPSPIAPTSIPASAASSVLGAAGVPVSAPTPAPSAAPSVPVVVPSAAPSPPSIEPNGILPKKVAVAAADVPIHAAAGMLAGAGVLAVNPTSSIGTPVGPPTVINDHPAPVPAVPAAAATP